MTQQKRGKIIQEMAQAIVRAVNPERIILFGSHAVGTATDNSDADFIVVEKGDFGPGRSRRKEAAKIWRALLHFDIAKDILLYTADEIRERTDDPCHVVGQALRTGKVLYAKS